MPTKLEELMLTRPLPVSGDVKYPTTGVSNIGDDILRGIAVGTGIEEQRPGDPAGAIGAMTGLLPIMGLGKLAKFFPRKPKAGLPSNIGDALLRQHVLPPEFHAMPNENPLADLPREEIEKAIDLARPRPHLERKK